MASLRSIILVLNFVRAQIVHQISVLAHEQWFTHHGVMCGWLLVHPLCDRYVMSAPEGNDWSFAEALKVSRVLAPKATFHTQKKTKTKKPKKSTSYGRVKTLFRVISSPLQLSDEIVTTRWLSLSSQDNFEEDVWNEERTFWLSTSAIWSIKSFVVQTLLHETKS